MWSVFHFIINQGSQDSIVHSLDSVTLLGGGQVNKAQITEALLYAPLLAAADGGAKIAVKMGHIPKIVIGDFDSIDKKTLAKIPPNRLKRIPEQESTDFEKCLTNISAPLILGIGFMGGRVDHQLAAFNALVRHAHQPCILIGKRDLCFHVPPKITLVLTPKSRLSLFPMANVRGSSAGLEWPIDGLDFAPAGRIGTSNMTKTGSVTLQMDGPGMLAIVPRAELASIVGALQQR
jgi:thiamine pyrophosphokinase